MARNKVLSTEFTFTTDVSRTITITSDKFLGFNRGNIRLIYNCTQKVLICGLSKKANVTVNGNNIVFSESLPILNVGDEITIEMDMGYVGTDALVNEMNNDKVVVAKAISDKGQQCVYTDNSVQMAAKIRAISSTINVATISGNPPDWHNLNEAVASVNDVNYPYKYALLIPKGVDKVYLQGGNLFTMSDGISTPSTGYYTFDKTKDDLTAVKAFYEGQMTWMTNLVRIESNTAGMSGNVNLIVHVGETITSAIALHNSISDNNKKISLISGNGNASPTLGDSVISKLPSNFSI